MNIDSHQADLINRALQRLSLFTELYGDDESESILKALNEAFSTKIESPKNLCKTTITLRFTDKAKAQVLSKYFRAKTFLAVRKEFVDVEVSIVGTLSHQPRHFIDELLKDADLLNSSMVLDGDVSEYLLHTALLLGSSRLISIKDY